MQPRSKWWIITIALLFVFSFLFAFQPIRFAPKDTVPEATFRYTWPQPLVTSEAEMGSKAAEIQSYLTSKGMNIQRVEFIEQNVLEVETQALDREQEAQDRTRLLSELGQKYPGATAMALPEEQREEQPIAEFGPIAIYRPVPQLRLGLDLIGGAHVVLRALPETTLTYSSPEDRPLVAWTPPPPAAGAPTPTAPTTSADGKPITWPTMTREMLSEGIVNVLLRAGLDQQKRDQVDVSFPSDNMVVVKTPAANSTEASRHNELVTEYLNNQYAGVTITAREPESIFLEADTAEKVLEIMERRLYAMGEVREPVLQKQGDDRVIIELPGIRDQEYVLDILQSTALLEFRVIPDRFEAPGAAQDEFDEWRDKQTGQTVTWEFVKAQTTAAFTGRDLLSNSAVSADETGGWVVTFELRNDRKDDFRKFTNENIKRAMAIVLDDEVQMAPIIEDEIPGQGIIRGNFDTKEARKLKLLLNAGALPVPLEIAENRTISATLGAEATQRALLAGMIGLAAIVVFMVAMYRLPGVLAIVALALYILLTLTVLIFTKTIITLPGIAGIILSIGMAVDANILAFERLKEEVWNGKAIRSSIDAGFERAWTAILDSNMNSLIVAAVLYFLGTSSVKSFAVTLFWGVVCSMFTAVTVSRWMLTIAGTSRLGLNLRLFGVRQGDA